jgi:hypothetical protein
VTKPVTKPVTKALSNQNLGIRPFAVLAVGSLVVLAGCQNPAFPWSRAGRIRNNLTPELATLDQTPLDLKNQDALMRNENFRMARDDLIRAFYLDRPSRLTTLPMPH